MAWERIQRFVLDYQPYSFSLKLQYYNVQRSHIIILMFGLIMWLSDIRVANWSVVLYFIPLAFRPPSPVLTLPSCDSSSTR